ncbi:uncharacterized protein [Venturia canescens]|uniref:uncharacterized protein n=1 Tax=Venturia canescens TaxID=32260 RepID=UPI001C9BE7C4|nr:uncharacterized protein LOC122408424 [Venturia canescens]
MAQAVRLYEQSYQDDYKDSMPRRIWAAALSNRASRAYTFLFALKKLQGPKLKKMTIHVIGSNIVEMDSAYYWRHLLHLIEDLQELNIVFVGPELEIASKKVSCCNHCNIQNRWLSVLTVGDLYVDFAARKGFSKPDYVIGFNLELYDFREDDTWTSSFRVLVKLGCSFIVTALSATTTMSDQAAIQLILKKKIDCTWSGKNPFAAKIPVPRPTRKGPYNFGYSNEYLTIYKKLS